VTRRLPPEPVLWTDAVAEAAQADLSSRLARNVRAARAETGLSQERAAERASLSWIYWRQLEAGKGKGNPSLRVLAQVAVALGVDPARLLLRTPAVDDPKPGRPTYPEPPFPTATLHAPPRPKPAATKPAPATAKTPPAALKKPAPGAPPRRTAAAPRKKSGTPRTPTR
jgi:transcriptional regulator with XRE-family HTH domain